MATFVQLTEEDPAYDLAGLLAQINHPEGKEAKETQQKELSNLVAAHEYTKIIDTFFNSMDKVLAAPEKDINTVFNMCFSLISQLSAETATQCVGRFVSALTKDQQHPLLKLKLLSTLFNLLGPSHRHHIFLHILRFALSTNQTAVLSGQFESLESWTRDWKVSTQEEADLYLLAAQTSRANNQPSQHQRFLLQYLKALEKGTAEQRQAAKEHAISAIKTAIDSTAIADCDTLLRLQAVNQLADDSKQRPAFELLQIVSQQNVESYSKFASSHRDFIAGLGLDHERLLRKMRHLTICSLGAEHTTLPYSSIQQHLSLPSINDVEEQVIEAVASGLLDAKLDQEQQTVHIQRATARTFNQDTWKGLAEKLELWKRNVRDVLGVVMQARQQGKLPQ